MDFNSLIQDTLSLDLVNTCAWTTIDTTVWLIWYPKVTCIFVFFDIFTRILWWCCKFSINPRFDKEMTRLKNHRNCVEQSIFYFVFKKLKIFGAMDNLIFYGFSDQSIFPWNRGLKKKETSHYRRPNACEKCGQQKRMLMVFLFQIIQLYVWKLYNYTIIDGMGTFTSQ